MQHSNVKKMSAFIGVVQDIIWINIVSVWKIRIQRAEVQRYLVLYLVQKILQSAINILVFALSV